MMACHICAEHEALPEFLRDTESMPSDGLDDLSEYGNETSHTPYNRAALSKDGSRSD